MKMADKVFKALFPLLVGLSCFISTSSCSSTRQCKGKFVMLRVTKHHVSEPSCSPVPWTCICERWDRWKRSPLVVWIFQSFCSIPFLNICKSVSLWHSASSRPTILLRFTRGAAFRLLSIVTLVEHWKIWSYTRRTGTVSSKSPIACHARQTICMNTVSYPGH